MFSKNDGTPDYTAFKCILIYIYILSSLSKEFWMVYIFSTTSIPLPPLCYVSQAKGQDNKV